MLTAIIGNMGSGKTATMSYIAYLRSQQHKNIFSNYALKNMNYTQVLSVSDIDNVKFGEAFYDEFWLWLDSRTSSHDEYNKKISDILLKSRKRGYNITYTLQGFYQIDKRIRNVTDYILVPELLFFNDGELQKFEQDFLFPFDTTPYLENMVAHVDVCRPVGEYELEKIDEFSYWLRDAVGLYDTSQEIEDIKNPLQKGIYIEGTCVVVLKQAMPDAIINQSPNSGHYLNTLDIEIETKKGLTLIDVSSIVAKKVNGYQYFYVDFTKKDISKIIKIIDNRKAAGLMAYKFLKQWYFFDLKNKKVSELLENKDKINLRDIKDIVFDMDKLKELIS